MTKPEQPGSPTTDFSEKSLFNIPLRAWGKALRKCFDYHPFIPTSQYGLQERLGRIEEASRDHDDSPSRD